MDMRFAKIVFSIAGIYGLLILGPIYFMEGKIGRETASAITHPEHFYSGGGPGLAGVVSGAVKRSRAISRDDVPVHS